MSDLYTEVLVKKQQTGKDKAIKGVLIFFTVLFAAAGIMMNPLILLLALVLGIVDYIFIPKLSVEFEYLYVNGELDIDRNLFAVKKEKEPQAMSFPTWKSWLRTSPISSIPTKTIRASNVTTIPPESKDRVTNRMHLLFQKTTQCRWSSSSRMR